MSTDDDLGARLHEAGRRWREANTTVATVDLAAATVDPAATGSAETGSAETPGSIADHGAGPGRPTEVPLARDPLVPPRRRCVRNWIATASGTAAAVAAALVVVHVADRPTTVPPARPSGTQALVGTRWTLARLEDFRAGPDLQIVGQPPTLQFDGQTLVAGDGCSTISGPATVATDEISIGPLAGAAVGCTNRQPAFINEVNLIRAVLSAKVQWSIEQGALTITKSGVGLLGYVPTPARGPGANTDPKALMTSGWVLESATTASGQSTSSGDVIYLRFETGHVLILDSCSPGLTYRLQIVAARGVLGVGGRIVADGACRPLNAVLASLSGSSTWSITGDRLTLVKPNGAALAFRRTDVDRAFTGTSGSPSEVPSGTSTR